MCGIAGFVRLPGAPAAAPEPRIAAMTARLSHRGPDQRRTWVSRDGAVALGHTRLSILDVSERGAQPYADPSGRHRIVFNGEIYNHLELRGQLERSGHSFRSGSDTETLLLAIREWGVKAALERCEGMFAFAYLDEDQGELHLARDRLGEKPLYFGRVGGHFVFASELKALQAFAAGRLELRREAVEEYLRFGFVPDPISIFEGVEKLAPGTMLRLRLGSGAETRDAYWRLHECAAAGAARPFRGGLEEAASALEPLLRGVIRQQLVADVPVGAMLSGGIDSSLVVALAQAEHGSRLRTYTIGFEQQEFNEARHATEVARHLGTDHHELYVGAADALRVISRLPSIYDEPFADSSQIPTFLVAELARGGVKVCLSGDGGDEAFAGYNRHVVERTAWKRIAMLPRPLRVAIAAAAGSLPAGLRNEGAGALAGILGRRSPPQLAEKIEKLVACLRARNFTEAYFALVALDSRPGQLLAGSKPPPRVPALQAFLPPLPEGASAQLLDGLFYLPGDILVKVDRASMAVGLETRAPFLDRRVLDFAWSLPPELRVRGTEGKQLLRALLARHVPTSLTDRPKRGFAIPINHWLRGELRGWAESLLSREAVLRGGLLDPAAVQRLWRGYLSGRENSQYRVWNVLMLQAWQADRHAALLAPTEPHAALPAEVSLGT